MALSQWALMFRYRVMENEIETVRFSRVQVAGSADVPCRFGLGFGRGAGFGGLEPTPPLPAHGHERLSQ